jgi:hypothetical protein
MAYFPPINSQIQVFEVASQSSQVALNATPGDICIRTDLNTSFVLARLPASTFANWDQILSPGGSGTVTSISTTTGTGISAVVTNPTTTPNISFTLGGIDESQIINLTTDLATLTANFANFLPLSGGEVLGDLIVDGTTTFQGASTTITNFISLLGSSTGDIKIKAPASPNGYAFIFPATGGTINYVLSTDGTGVSNWVAPHITTIPGDLGQVLLSSGSNTVTVGAIPLTVDPTTGDVTFPADVDFGANTLTLNGTTAINFNYDPLGAAALAQSNAETFAMNATNLILGTVALARLTQSSASTSGYLSNADWNTFNNKVSSPITSVTSANGLTLTTGVLAFSGSGYDTAGAAATAQSNAESFATSADTTVLSTAEAYSANASNLSSGTVANARLGSVVTRIIGFSATSPVTGQQGSYVTFPVAGTISAWNIGVDAGTATIKVWKIATGTATPTSANSINTSGVAISTGTAIRSTTLTDFTTTTVSANDIFGFQVTAVATATKLLFELEITLS